MKPTPLLSNAPTIAAAVAALNDVRPDDASARLIVITLTPASSAKVAEVIPDSARAALIRGPVISSSGRRAVIAADLK